MFKFDVTFSDDLKSATVKFPQEIQATAENFGELIAEFAPMRSQMNPPVSTMPSAGMGYAFDNPALWVSPEVMRGGAVLRLRHPGLGWLNFWLPQTEATKMIELLQEHGLTPADSSAPRSAN